MHGRKLAAERMVTSAKRAGRLDGDNVRRLLDDAENVSVTLLVGARGAGIAVNRGERTAT